MKLEVRISKEIIIITTTTTTTATTNTRYLKEK